MTELVITRGLPASGKTTWARAWIEEDPKWRARVNRDDLRWNLYGVYWGLTYEQEKAVSAAQRGAVKGLLADGVSVVVDDTNLKLKHARGLAELADRVGAAFRTVDFTDVPVDECVKRDIARASRNERAVGGDVIRKMHLRYLAQGPLAPVTPSEKPQGAASVYEPDETLPRAWLVDIDGTLARMGERGPFEWARVGEDEPVPGVLAMAEALGRDGAVLLMSGRDEVCRGETRDWLSRHGIGYEELHMRPAGDFRADSTVKEEIFWQWIAPRFNVVGVLDDRNRVVEMWRRLGLTCAQVAPGDF